MKSKYINYSTQESVPNAQTQNASIPLNVERMLATQNSRSTIRSSDLNICLTSHFRSLFLRKFNQRDESAKLFHLKSLNLDSLGYSRAY